MEMLTNLRARMFKSWFDTGDLKLAPLTGLFGANSSGKTSLLQLLLMLKQTVESPDRSRVLHTGDMNSLVDLGTYYDLVHEHRPEQELSFSIAWSLDEPLIVFDPETENKPLFEPKEMALTSRIHEESGRPVVNSFEDQFGSHTFGMNRKGVVRPKGARENSRTKEEYDLVSTGYQTRRIKGRPWPLPSPVKCYGFPEEAVGYFQNTGFLPDFVLAFEDLLRGIAYLGPLREYPRRSYVWAGERPRDVGRRGGDAVPALLAARAEGMKSGRGRGRGRRYALVEKRIAEWLKKMNLIHLFSLQRIAKNRKEYELRVKKTARGSDVLITDVGFGVSQILPVLVLCYYVPEGSTVILEQPEIHLHPSVQTMLADVLIDVVNERRVQVIVESHSEHLLLRLQRRIAEGLIDPKDTTLYFCKMTERRSEIERLQVNLSGDIENWPPDFFGDEMSEHTARMRAALAREQAGP